MAVKDYSTDPDMNVQISGINIAEGCAPSGINNAIRQLMADVAANEATEDEAGRVYLTDSVSVSSGVEQKTAVTPKAVAKNFLALTGGTMTGNLSLGSALAGKLNGEVTFGVGTMWNDGPSLSFYGPNHSGAVSGGFILRAGTATVQLVGRANGTLSWNESQVFLPPGAVFAFAGNSVPSGCLSCNGAAVSRTTYAALFAAIGTTYGTGDGSTTFNLPDLTDKFIQGSDTAGTVKAAGLPNIAGTLTGVLMMGSATPSGALGKEFTGTAVQGGSAAKTATLGFYAKNSNSIYGASTTVQPPAVTMRYYIKY